MHDKEHWQDIWARKKSNEVSWYQQNPKTSIDLILSVNPNKNARIIDVGGGDSGNSVSGASVTIQLKRYGADYGNPATGNTDSSGNVKFVLRNAPSGTYTTVIKAVSGSNISWDGYTPSNSFIK